MEHSSYTVNLHVDSLIKEINLVKDGNPDELRNRVKVEVIKALDFKESLRQMENGDTFKNRVGLSERQMELLIKALNTSKKNALRSAENCKSGFGKSTSLVKAEGYKELAWEYDLIASKICDATI